MLRQYRQIKKVLWRQIVLYFTVLTLLFPPGMIQQLMAQEHNKKQHLRLIEARARALRTYVDPTLSLARQQQLLSYKQLRNCKKTLARIKAGEDVESMVKDTEALQQKIKNTHLGLKVELMDMHARLLENNMPQKIVDRHNKFC